MKKWKRLLVLLVVVCLVALESNKFLSVSVYADDMIYVGDKVRTLIKVNITDEIRNIGKVHKIEAKSSNDQNWSQLEGEKGEYLLDGYEGQVFNVRYSIDGITVYEWSVKLKKFGIDMNGDINIGDNIKEYNGESVEYSKNLIVRMSKQVGRKNIGDVRLEFNFDKVSCLQNDQYAYFFVRGVGEFKWSSTENNTGVIKINKNSSNDFKMKESYSVFSEIKPNLLDNSVPIELERVLVNNKEQNDVISIVDNKLVIAPYKIKDEVEVELQGNTKETEYSIAKRLITRFKVCWPLGKNNGTYTVEGDRKDCGWYKKNVSVIPCTEEKELYEWNSEVSEWLKVEQLVTGDSGERDWKFIINQELYKEHIKIDNDNPKFQFYFMDKEYKKGKSRRGLTHFYGVEPRIVLDGYDKESGIKYQDITQPKFSHEESIDRDVNNKFIIRSTYFDKIEYEIEDNVGNRDEGELPDYYMVDTTIPPTPQLTLLQNDQPYTPGTWTKDDVTVKLSVPQKELSISGLEKMEYTTKDPKECSDADWKELKMDYGTETVDAELKINEHTCSDFYFRSCTNCGVRSTSTKAVPIYVQKNELVNAECSISKGSMGKDGWYTTYPTIQIKQPSNTRYSDENAPITTHYKLSRTKGKEYKVVEEKKFDRGSELVHIPAEPIVNPALNKDGRYKLEVWTTDSCGNKTDVITNEFKADTNAPRDLTVVYHKNLQNGFIKEILTKSGLISIFKSFARYVCEGTDADGDFDGSGLKKYEYSLDRKTWTTAEKGVLQILANYVGKVYVRAYDNAGNISGVVCKMVGRDNNSLETLPDSMIVDSQQPGKPEIKAATSAGDYTPDTWTNQPIELCVESKIPISGIDHYEYTTIVNPKDSDWKVLNDSTKTQLHMSDTIDYINDKIVIKNDTNKTFYFRAVSNANNISEVSSIKVKLQVTRPDNAIVKITPDSPDGDNGWYAKKSPIIFVSHNPKTNQSSLDAKVTTYYKLWNISKDETEEKAEVHQFNEGEIISSPAISGDGIYYLKVWTRDEAGNSFISTTGNDYDQYVVKVDCTHPTGSVIIGENKYDELSSLVNYFLSFNHMVLVKMQGEDNLSGVQSIEYQKVKEIEDFDQNGKWTSYKPYETMKNEKFIMYLRVTDYAGNHMIVNSDGVIIDMQKPEGKNRQAITISPTGLNKAGIANKNVNVDVVVCDPDYYGVKKSKDGVHSGLQEVTYSIQVDGKEKVKKTLFSDKKVKESYKERVNELQRKIKINAKQMEGNQVVIKVHATDKAGNEAENQYAMRIDVTKPVMSISYDNNKVYHDKYYDTGRTIKLAVDELNFKGKNVELNVLKDGKKVSIHNLKWSHHGNRHEANYSLTQDGEYEVTAAYIDEAGNQASYSDKDEFVVDQIKPEVQLEMSKTASKNGNYYNNNQKAVIHVKEQNFDKDVKLDVQIVRDGKKESAPVLGKWTQKDKYYEAPITFSKSGDYTVKLKCKDSANNESEIKPVTFHIDQEKPEIKIDGVKDQSSNQGKLIPVIKVSDLYQDQNAIKLKLTGVNHGNIPITVKRETTKHVTSYVLDMFPKKQDIDDIYTLHVSSTDLAGNKNERKLKFSLNRYGSVYTYDEKTQSVREKYKTKPQEIRITETNVDYLDKYYVKVSCNDVVRDLEENKDFSVKITGQKTGIKNYEYKIKPEVFQDDGYYSVHIYSQDKAKNQSDNQSKHMECNFVVDKTEPVCVVSGVESGKAYDAKEKTVRVTVNDNSYIDKLVIMKNGVEVSHLNKEQVEKCNGQLEVKMQGSNDKQFLEFTCIDAAGNQIVKTVKDVLVTTNPWIRFYNNKPLFYSGIAAVIMLLIGGVLLIIHKKEEAAS